MIVHGLPGGVRVTQPDRLGQFAVPLQHDGVMGVALNLGPGHRDGRLQQRLETHDRNTCGPSSKEIAFRRGHTFDADANAVNRLDRRIVTQSLDRIVGGGIEVRFESLACFRAEIGCGDKLDPRKGFRRTPQAGARLMDEDDS